MAFSASNTEDLSWHIGITRVELAGSGNPYNQPLTMRDMIKGFTVGGYATTRETNVGKLHLGYAVECYRDDNGNMKHSYLFQPWQYSGLHSIINF